jgi:hypothetical protein
MKGVPRQASPPGRRADAAAHVAQQFADALPALALARLVFGGCTLGGEPAFFGVLRPARFCFPVEAIALGGNAGRKLWHELACRGPLDQAKSHRQLIRFYLLHHISRAENGRENPPPPLI